MSRVIVLLGLLSLASPPASPAQQADSSAVSRMVRELHRLVNEQRRAAGCEDLLWHEATARVAEEHSKDMSVRDYFDHLSPEGTDPSARMLRGDVAWHGSIAENIALTGRGPSTVIELWMNSSPHRRNIENCTFTHEGLGVYRDRWTQVLVERPDP